MYHCMHFLHDGVLGSFNGISGAYETDLALNVLPAGRRDVDFAASVVLHVLDGFTPYRMLSARHMNAK